MNILITGRQATGKTNIINLLATWLKARGDKVLYIEEVFTDHKPKDVELPALDKYKGNSKEHLIIVTQSAEYIYPDILDKFDLHINPKTREMGEWIWKLLAEVLAKQPSKSAGR